VLRRAVAEVGAFASGTLWRDVAVGANPLLNPRHAMSVSRDLAAKRTKRGCLTTGDCKPRLRYPELMVLAT
jgi:hypothetical protein